LCAFVVESSTILQLTSANSTGSGMLKQGWSKNNADKQTRSDPIGQSKDRATKNVDKLARSDPNSQLTYQQEEWGPNQLYGAHFDQHLEFDRGNLFAHYCLLQVWSFYIDKTGAKGLPPSNNKCRSPSLQRPNSKTQNSVHWQGKTAEKKGFF
jgi:hypothetical protein